MEVTQREKSTINESEGRGSGNHGEKKSCSLKVQANGKSQVKNEAVADPFGERRRSISQINARVSRAAAVAEGNQPNQKRFHVMRGAEEKSVRNFRGEQ